MKKIISIIFLISIGFWASAQTINQTNAAGQKTGKWQKKYDNGQLKYKGQFENGYEVGEFIYFFPDGKIQSKLVFSEKGVMTTVSIYYKNGSQQATGFYRNKLKHGTWKYFNAATGIISKQETYADGKKDGVFRIYYSNEQISTEVYWKQDVRDGTWQEFFENGNIRLSTQFVNGNLDGEYKTYYAGKKISRKGQYVNGKLDGVWITYNEQGIYTTYERYKMGFLELERIYEDGIMVLEMDNVKHTVTDLRKNVEPEEEIEEIEDGGKEQ